MSNHNDQNPDNSLFDDWIKLKKRIHQLHKLPTIREGEIWWCGIGKNVGIEINGKSKKFSRPILIYKKLSKYGFIGIPLTSQPHNGPWYTSFIFKNRKSYAALSQIRVMNTSRLYGKLGQLPKTDLEKVRKALLHFIS